MERSSGILMHISSLPSPYGIGTLGREAYAFVDFLAEAGQRYWQLLPLGPTGVFDSPYQSFSTYAGNPYFIDLEQLVEQQLLTQEECDSFDFGKNPIRKNAAYTKFCVCSAARVSENVKNRLAQQSAQDCQALSKSATTSRTVHGVTAPCQSAENVLCAKEASREKS